MTIDLIISILLSNVLIFCAWWVGVQIKKNSEIIESSEDITGTELYHDWLPKNK